MKRVFLLFSIPILACGPAKVDEASTTPTKDTLDEKEVPVEKSDSLVYYNDTLDLMGSVIIAVKNEDRPYCLLDEKGDTLLKWADYYHREELVDFNLDGYTDVRVWIFSNNTQCENFLFDTASRKFRHIKNCWLDIERMKGTPYFYSYDGAGCADMNWESHLSKIENWALEEVGLMDVHACGDKQDGIRVYKISEEGKDSLILSMPVKKWDNNGKNNKFAFAKAYWQKNHKAFE